MSEAELSPKFFAYDPIAEGTFEECMTAYRKHLEAKEDDRDRESLHVTD